MDTILAADRATHLRIVDDFLKCSKYPQYVCGLWPEWTTKWTIMLAIFNMALTGIDITCQQIFVVLNYKNVNYAIGAYATCSPIIYMYIRQWLLLVHRKDVLELLRRVREDFWPVQSLDPDGAVPKVFKRVFIFMVSQCVATITLCVVWNIFPFETIPGNRKLPFLIWLPFDVNKSPTHEIVYTLIVICGCIFVPFGISALDSLIFFFVCNIWAQYRMMKQALREINTENHDERHIFEELKFVTKHHLLMRDFCQLLKKVYNVNFALIVGAGKFTATVNIFLLQRETDTERFMKLILYCVVITIDLAMYCSMGSVLETFTETLAEAAYECPWYETHPRLRLGLMQVIQAAREPEKFTAYGMVDINNELFVSCLQTGFSVATLLSTMDT